MCCEYDLVCGTRSDILGSILVIKMRKPGDGDIHFREIGIYTFVEAINYGGKVCIVLLIALPLLAQVCSVIRS